MQGKVVVITGGTSGIGQVATERLAAIGARIVLVARSRSRGEAALERLRTVGPREPHRAYYGDVSRLADLKRLGEEIRSAEPRIDVLINNAGAVFSRREVSADGMEMTFATNHISYFVLTLGLRDALLAAGAARVINTSSHAHYRATIDFDNLQFQRNYKPVAAYNRSKLCNILFTRELTRRFAGTAITANSLHPGLVNTRLADGSGGWVAPVFGVMKKMFGITPEKGAETIVYLASSPDVTQTSGLYFYQCKAVKPSKLAQDEALAAQLWKETVKLTGIDA